MTTPRSIQAHDLHAGRRAHGATWATTRVQAWCQCGWASPWRHWAQDPSTTAVVNEAVRADLADHHTSTGHTAFPAGQPQPPGYHQRCGWFHAFDDACPTPADSPAGRIQRVAQASLRNPVTALDRLAAINELRAWLDDQEIQAVIGARMTRCRWESVALAAGITREHALDRWASQIARFEAAGLLEPDPPAAALAPVTRTGEAPES